MTEPNILVLGVGGGAVIKQLHLLFKRPTITGIDLDATHLALARRWFGVNSRRDTLVCADAQEWLSHYGGQRFDIIVDDLFIEQQGEPVRAIPLSTHWSKLLLHNLNSAGMIIVNCASRAELKGAKLNAERKIKQRFYLEHALYENCIGIFMRQTEPATEFHEALEYHPALSAAARKKARQLRLVKIS